MDDSELVDLAQAGEKAASGILIERYQPMAVRVAVGVVRQKDTARELVNESMLQAFLSLDRLRGADRFRSWLYGIVLNVCRSYLRDQGRAPLSLEELAGGTRFEAIPFTSVEPDPQEVAEARELHEIVLRSVSALSPRNRAATLLFYYEQLSVREIAATLDVSVSAVKRRLYNARLQLRNMLLPLYADSPTQMARRRRGKMVQVEIADVIASKGTDRETGGHRPMTVVVLIDKVGRRMLPLWIGEWEGQAIVMGLKDIQLPRPLTYSFIANILETMDVQLEEVRIEALKGDTFYAVASLRQGDTLREVDARPSDALALAVRAGSPILVAEEVMEKGMDMPPDAGEPPGAGIDALAEEIKERMAGHPSQEGLMSLLYGGKGEAE